jgi:hypothetical protein
MKKKKQAFETKEHDLTGYASLDFFGKGNFNSFAARTSSYDPARFDPVALKIFMQGRSPVVTLFALDKFKKPLSPRKKLPVKKFKFRLTWQELFLFVKRFDIVVSNGAYDIEDMLVVNK